MIKNFLTVMLCLCMLNCCFANNVAKSNSIPQESNSRMQWWRDARFGVFVHWGLYAVPAGRYNGEEVEGYSEWIMAYADIPVCDYEEYAKTFNPTAFNAKKWVKTVVASGAKYLVITSKHHEGFSMFDTKLSDYDIVDATPFGKDPLAELVSACKDIGLSFGFYYSQLDWHHDSQGKNPEYVGRPAYRNGIMKDGQKERYVEYMRAQLRELIEKYDPEILWFDGEWVDWWTLEDGKNLESFLRTLKPSLVINNRIGKRTKECGDFGTPEQEIPDTGLDYDWETCMTINDNWGYDKADHNWKSTETLLRNLVDIASKGGNFLLNVGPTAEGIIPEPSVERLEEIGKWLKINGESIYGTSASPFEKPKWGRYTLKDNYLYAHIFEWPKNNILEVSGCSNELTGVKAITRDGYMPLNFTQEGSEIKLSLLRMFSEAVIPVVLLEFERDF